MQLNIQTIQIIYKRLEILDDELKSKDLLIHQRHVHAIFEYQKKYNETFAFDSEKSNIISEWYKLMYGDNLKNSRSEKNFLIKIKGDIFIFTAPDFMGTIEFFWGSGKIVKPVSLSRTTIKYDIRYSIHNITEGYTSFMDQNDVNHVGIWAQKIIFINNYFLDKIRENVNDQYNIIYNDLISAKEHFMIQSYDMVEWQCLQTAEKLLKLYIKTHKNVNPAQIHLLWKLNQVAQINDPIILDLIPKIETSPSYRYELKSSRQSAFNKYDATINFIESMIKIL